jgi:hypothetical protein
MAIRGHCGKGVRVAAAALALCLLAGSCADRREAIHPRTIQVARQCGHPGVVTLICMTW